MIKAEYEDYQRRSLAKWGSRGYFIQEISINNIFNWKDANIKFNSPISVITGKNGVGKSTFINAIKQVYDLQNNINEFGILSELENYRIKLVNRQNRELLIENKNIVNQGFRLPLVKDLSFNLKNYIFFKNSTGYDMKTYIDTLDQYDPISMSGNQLNTMKYLIEKQIISAEKIVDEEDNNREYFRLKLEDGTIYDSYTMGSGEYFINQFIWNLQSLPKGSIAIIEELENYIHPDAQKKLIELIYEYSILKDIQFLVTTHSPTLIDHVNLNSRILIKLYNSKVIPINDCPNWLAKDVIGNTIDDKITVLLEDEKAISLFRNNYFFL